MEFTYLGNTVRHDEGTSKENQEPLSESHQCSQHAQQCIEVPAVEHQDQAKTIS